MHIHNVPISIAAQNAVSPPALNIPTKIVIVIAWKNNKNADTYNMLLINSAVCSDEFINDGAIGLIANTIITTTIPKTTLIFTKNLEKLITSSSCFLPLPIRFPNTTPAAPPSPIIATPESC